MFESKLLEGKCVLITRPFHQSYQLADELRSHGAEVQVLPLIRICPPDSWDNFDRAIKHLDLYEWIIFASSNAVETTFARAGTFNLIDATMEKKIAVIGSATAASLERLGGRATLIAPKAVAESLIESFARNAVETSQSKMILWPRTNIGRNTIKEGLESSGWQVEIVHSYKTEGPENPQEIAKRLRELLELRKVSTITLTSSEITRKFQEILLIATTNNAYLQEDLLKEVKLAVIGAETAKTCREIFGRVDAEASESSVQGLVHALQQLYN